MAQVHKISGVKNAAEDPSTFAGSLAKEGYNRFPGAIVRKAPYLETNGKYRTGLDEDALYIRKMSEEEQLIEKAKVRELYKKAQDMYGDMDLSPTSDFYVKMTDRLMGTEQRCPFSKLTGETNVFHINETKEDLILFAYLRVLPDIAPSLEALSTGAYAGCKFFVDDMEIEDDKSFKIKQLVNKAAFVLDDMSLAKRKKIGRQLGIAITDNTSEASTYKMIDDFIKKSEETKQKKNAELFLKFAEMKDDNLDARDLIAQAVQYGVLRKKTDGSYWRGDNQFAKDEETMIAKLVDISYQDDYETIQNELKMKKFVNV